ncbi:alcohol dehydrogenase class-P-like [Cryptomeria japonica]|uniref:alcohol dehydrogenase class-P-like n=1 Tax=Cryptomeria japonica TaxID=3369 RepID=UPI0027DA793B|nr:alcohol dehydrogenase class-P-like [Cryptomeria japonica]
MLLALLLVLAQMLLVKLQTCGVSRGMEAPKRLQPMNQGQHHPTYFRGEEDVYVRVGVAHSDAAFCTSPIHFLNERTLKGTFFGNYKPKSDLPVVVDKYMNNEVELEKFITHNIDFADINKAFEYMLRGESLRCVIKVHA